MESKKVIEIKNINKLINKKRILNNISFDIFEGDCVALIGPNGAGKTTLMNCLLGNKFVDSGSIKINWEEILNDKPLNIFKKGIKNIPEDRHKRGLILDFTVSENIVLQRYKEPKFSKNGILKKDAI